MFFFLYKRTFLSKAVNNPYHPYVAKAEAAVAECHITRYLRHNCPLVTQPRPDVRGQCTLVDQGRVNLEGTFPSFSFILLSDPVTAGRGDMRVNITVQSSQCEGLKAHVGVVVNDFVII